MIINGYNMSTEIASLLLCVLVLFLMFVTKPRKTEIYNLDFLGFVASVVFITLQQYILYQIGDTSVFNPFVFNITCFAFYLVYHGILAMIFMYIILVASNKEDMKPKAKKMAFYAYIIFSVIAAFFCFSGKMYKIVDGTYMLSNYFYIFLLFGLIDAVATFVLSFLNRRNMARILYTFIWLFDLIEVVLLVLQIFWKDTFFVSLTYVLPFSMFYILFHSNPYDEVSGCQNAYSFETRFLENVYYHGKYMITVIQIPALQNEFYAYTKDEVKLITANICRKAEKIHRKIHLYSMNKSTYAVFVKLKNKENEKVIFTKTNKLLNQEIEIHNRTLRIRYKMVGFSDNEYVKNMSQYNSMVHFLFDQLEKSQEKMYYCQEEDYDKFASQYRIFEVLMDIKCHVDLNDSRVECYVQPIFEIESQCFRTAEALMRLSIDGKTIYPDQFIELAEEHNCIHELTCIMLNKVCKNINLMQEKYKFDAITVNCSTSEFSNYKLHSELLEIIKKNKISPSKIRLELTESTMYDDYAAVLHNMSKLKMEGVEFYLDDFGTGYSNLERIISCPFRTIKFDKSLLYKAIEDRNLNALVISMVQVFKQQGIVLLMEGVENEKQRDYTIKAGFDYIQGYFYSKPVPIAKLKDVFEPVE